MSVENYLPLHVNSIYSMLYGTRKTSELVKRAKTFGYKKMALTDRNNLYAVHDFIRICSEYKITPIIGVEAVCNKDQAVLLAKNKTGFSNISSIITEINLEKEVELATVLQQYFNDIIIITESIEVLQSLQNVTDDLYMMVPPFGHRQSHLAKQYKFKTAAAGKSVFFDSSDIETHRVLRAIDLLKTVSAVESEECAPKNSYFLSKNDAEKCYGHDKEALLNCKKISDDCNYNSIFDGFIFPSIEFEDKSRPADVLRQKVYDGAEKRYGELNESVVERIEYELSIIEEKNFCEYFLAVSGIVSDASHTCGRGSAAASIVSFSLGITAVDPIKYNLYFERFLNPERNDMPDIDVDFAWDERDDIIENTIRHYGEDHCAMVCTMIHFRARSAIRDIARVYGIPEGEISMIEKKILRKNLHDTDEVWEKIVTAAKRVHGFPKHISVHVGGVVISPEPLKKYVPLEKAPKGVHVVTWDKDGVEDGGLVKIDLLGNRSLAVIRDAIANIALNGKILDTIKWKPAEDEKTKNLIENGDTIGVFYVESPAMRQLQKKTKRGDYEHLVIHSSIIRPAANRFINEYIDRLNGKKYQPLHPDLEYILKETYGIMVYQEDVSKAAVALAGFSAAKADGLRKILSKKNKEEKLKQYKENFFEGASKKGVEVKVIDSVWQMICSFSGYSFCKPHSASYAMVSFKSAYLKAHHRAEFMAAVLSNSGGYYTASAYISESKRLGLEILSPDINKSNYKYYGYDNKIQVGFMAVSGLRIKSAHQIIEERNNGEYRSLKDLTQRVDLLPSDCEILVYCGALDSICDTSNTAVILWELLMLVDKKKEKNKELLLFDNDISLPPELQDISAEEKIHYEYKILGFMCKRHPLYFYKNQISSYKNIIACDLENLVGSEIKIAGWMVTRKAVMASSGFPMEFVSFEDESDIFETVLFPEVYSKYGNLLEEESAYILSGWVENQKGAIVLNVSKIEKIKKVLS